MSTALHRLLRWNDKAQYANKLFLRRLQVLRTPGRHGLGSSQNQLSIFCIALLGMGSIITVGEHPSSGDPRLCYTLTV
jgi:hypothetical protein